MNKTTITPELLRNALSFVPSNLPRDEWARVGMAIKSEYPDETGLQLFSEWSAASGGTFDAAAVRSTWRSIKAGGGVGVSTLLFLAKQHGFKLPRTGEAAQPVSDAQRQRMEAERLQRNQAEQERIAAQQEAAATEAEALWGAASDTGQSAYLQRKGVQGFGVRYTPDGWLLVPVRDGAGRLWNVQRIAPQRPADGPDKLFLKGGRKSGLWHVVGGLQGAAVALLAEGYATAASLHMATGWPVVVAFDAGNLLHVAKAVRALLPDAVLLVCGDDDAATQARTGRNTGRMKAQAAARAVRAGVVLPAALPEGGSDFNDMHQANGLDAVREQVKAAMQVFKAKLQSSPQGSRSKASKQRVVAEQSPGEAVNAVAKDRFVVDDSGVWFTPPGDDGGAPRRVCGPLRVTGMACDASDNQAALLLEFDTPHRKGRRWLMPLHMLAGDGSTYRAALLSQGFMTPTDSKRRTWLTEYLQSRQPTELVRHVPRVGWHGRCYVLPDETLGTSLSSERVIFHSEAGVEANFNQRGALQQWRQDLARLCIGNSRLAFAVSAAFAGPLLAWAPGTTGGGFHFTGQTSIGKTTGFLIAASVWGKGTEKDPDSYIQKWRATSNGLEYQAEQHNDCTMILDELGQMENGDAGATAYMLADGMGKTRGKGMGGLRPKATWRLIFLSSGEITLAQQMEAVGKKMKGGQEVRLIPIPAEVRPGSAVEEFHEFDGGHELSTWVQRYAALRYGTAGRAWLEHLVSNTDTLAFDLRRRMEEIEAQMVPGSASGQVRRAGRRFALVAVAGEMATEAGLTDWPAGEAVAAVKTCFVAWLDSRGGDGSSEVASMLRQVRGFLEAHGEGRFTWWHRATDDHNAKTLQRAGFRRLIDADGKPLKIQKTGYTPGTSKEDKELYDTMTAIDGEETQVEYFVLPEVFRTEICRGFDYKAVCKVLLQHGCLKPAKGREYDARHRLPGVGHAWCYQFTPAIMELDI
ncbi:DUF927 domain-containing protein [Comamonas avium]|uniref:DUF927 domain-containing protein n=1 Tax=Comamonas avium TaxID=2762231 RepID=A0ABR8SFX2_9BURK|nr:DUF927 domain-containing protein [Comamonas avium]MBD7962395.1 DUF927 domain-containing protein [Comamonas avium]